MSSTKAPSPPSNVVTGVIKAMRPRQWVKNLLVLAAPLAALGVDKEYDYKQVFINVGIAFVVFSLAASSIYLVNDARDVEADRAHPTKRYRPIAAGVVPEWLAYVIAAVLAAVALGVSYFVVNPNLALVIAVYLAMQLAYCFGLKHQAVLDICIVSSAYLIRAIAGGAAAVQREVLAEEAHRQRLVGVQVLAVGDHEPAAREGEFAEAIVLGGSHRVS